MVHRRRSPAAWVPSLTAVVLGASALMPLRWSTVAATATALVVLGAIVRRAKRSSAPRAGPIEIAAAAAQWIVGGIELGYAVYALMHPGFFGVVRRLSYPFLVATGLRLDGGAWLLLLCGAAAVVPLLFQEDGARTLAP